MPGAAIRAALLLLRDYAMAVEYRSPKWTDGDRCDDTLAFLEDHDIAFVCVDDNSDEPPVVAATADVAMVRFVGRRTAPDDSEWAGWPWPYRYSDDELAGWVPSIAELASSSGDVHVLFANCWRDDAV